ncbi:hypothetical protein DYB36_005562 [Aphanomyces astaci]|uniref:Uncharacterized protein n=1 Tax=Aphanomyces astaci TaxID=112090 RepID=A0A397AYG5_APHAT|nr:hypothetical protein DYB36_005562 [Aphanomyces astaci]
MSSVTLPIQGATYEPSKWVETGPKSNNDNEITGRDWLHVEEVAGFFFSASRLRRECIVVDQPQHRLWCQQSNETMKLGHISFVIPIEDANAHPSWKVLVQDPKHYQEWTIHFPGKVKMLRWVDLLRQVMHSTHCSGVVRDCVLLTTTCSPINNSTMLSIQ